MAALTTAWGWPIVVGLVWATAAVLLALAIGRMIRLRDRSGPGEEDD